MYTIFPTYSNDWFYVMELDSHSIPVRCWQFHIKFPTSNYQAVNQAIEAMENI